MSGSNNCSGKYDVVTQTGLTRIGLLGSQVMSSLL
jgi:hypothetical protein